MNAMMNRGSRISGRWTVTAALAGVMALALWLGSARHLTAAGAEAAGAAGIRPLRVMCFNIRYSTAPDGTNSWPLRQELLLKTILDFNPDLLGIQEALADQCDFLQARLSGYAFHGVGRDDGKRAGEFVPVLYRQDRFEPVDAGHFWLSETPEVPGSRDWDAAITRMVSWVVLRDRQAGGREFVFANTHFDHRGEQARLESARLLRQRAEGVLPDTPVILVGDFNTTEDGEPYRVLVRPDAADPARLIDAYRVVHPERSPDEATYNGWRPVVRGSRIDWILHSTHFHPVSALINRTTDNGRLPSDHYPIEAVLQWR